MVSNVSLEQLRKLPHAYCEDMQNRIFPLHPLLDEENQWHLWVPNNDLITEMKGTPVESNYFAKTPERPDDIIFPFLEFLEKRALWPEIHPWTIAITNDLHNLAASMAKFDLMFQANKSSRTDIRRMISTELEYVFLTCKSLFDLLQKTIANLWEKITIQNPKNLKKRTLPPRFSKIALDGNNIRSVPEIEKKYQIPKELAVFYNRNAKFFNWLRDYRVSISHGTGEFDLIFVTEKGLAIHCDRLPFNSMNIWSSTNTIPEKLGSIKSVVSYIISYTLEAFDDAIIFFQSRIKFPADVVPNYRMYTRGINNKHLVNLKDNISNPW